MSKVHPHGAGFGNSGQRIAEIAAEPGSPDAADKSAWNLMPLSIFVLNNVKRVASVVSERPISIHLVHRALAEV
jgi:hypothetical protein